MPDTTLLRYLPELPLHRLDPNPEAGLAVVSLPWPRCAPQSLAFAGRATSLEPIGQWPTEAPGTPRRLLMFADLPHHAPETAYLSSNTPPWPGLPATAEMEEFERSPEPYFMWQRHLLRVNRDGRSLGIALGLRHAGELHWWEACSLVVHEEAEGCRVVEMGGTIPREVYGSEVLAQYPGYTNPYLHQHNWLNGKLYLRLHANGVCEVFAHFINSKFFDDGLSLADVIAVIGIRSDSASDAPFGPWDGSLEEFSLGDVRFDVSEAAQLATPAQPGAMTREDGFVVWQPFLGAELYGGLCPLDVTGDPFIIRAESKEFPRGMARTIRFNFSLSDRSPRIARYLAPAWWYGACEEFQPAPLLPVSNQYDEQIDSALTWIGEHMVHGGFEDGSVARHAGKDLPRHEPGWEGEMPYSQFLGAWRSGDAEDYSRALRSAYYFADVSVDHAAKSVRMHGYGGDAFSVPMNRLQGCIAGYLETGDPYLLDSARSVTETSYWTNKNSWPRMAVGRDACFIRSAVLLYRYFAEEHFRRMAHECSLMVAHSQRPDGSFGDQAGGTGIHAWGAYVTKPWMGLLALGGVIDYLELFPDEPKLAASVKRFADWLMAERWEHGGGMGWSYQHAYDGGRRYLHHPLGKYWELPTPNLWHHESLGRLLLFCSEKFDAPEYFQAWAESHAVANPEGGDHAVNARLQFLPWVQARLWNATLTPEGVQIDPRHWGPGTPEHGEVLIPHGRLCVWWDADGNARHAMTVERPVPAEVITA